MFWWRGNRMVGVGVLCSCGVSERIWSGGFAGVEFGRFAARVAPSLVRSGYLLTADRGHAEDLAQVTLWRTARRWGELSGSPDACAHKVLVNLSRDRRRSLKRRPLEVAQLDLVVDRGDDCMEALLERNAVVQAVRRLPRRQREDVVLRFLLDLSVAQTAAALGASEGTIKSYTARAIARLRDLLSEAPTAAAAMRSEVPGAE
jgi:RNA polymerase sigma-70 factor (sigma-E family)